jgi:bacterioferritin
MLPARADDKVLGYLGRALSLELSAVQLYSTQARLVAMWGLSDAAERMRHEAQEEMGHAERIIERMLAHGVAPNASMLRPVRLGGDLRELLLVDQAFERELVDLYADAVLHCLRVGNLDDRAVF